MNHFPSYFVIFDRRDGPLIKSEKMLYIKIVKIRRSLRRPVNSSFKVTVVAIYDTADIAKFDRRRKVRSYTQVNMRARRKGKNGQ